MKRSKSKTLPPDQSRREAPREEQLIFADLAALCTSPGFAHAIAFFCYRDNLVKFGEKLRPDDLARLHSGSALIRTEISTLIGLLVREPIDYALPTPQLLSGYIDRAEKLLEELHHGLSSTWIRHLNPEAVKSESFDPFSAGEALREPIFYGGDSAYNFQYRDFAARRYGRDTDWLLSNRGFDIRAALTVVDALRGVLNVNQAILAEDLSATPPEQWTALPAFCFSTEEISDTSGIALDTVRKIISAFTLGRDDRNTNFTTLKDYNATNALPILSFGSDEFVLFQHYSLLESLYESPIFWMRADKSYGAKALNNRGLFTEDIAYRCLDRVFGACAYKNIFVERRKGSRIGEIDVIVLFGDRAIVVQGKAKPLTIEARKGNDLRIKDDFKKAVQESYDQALLCSKALAEGTYRLTDAGGRDISLVVPIRQIFPVCIVADHYPALAFQARQFLKYETSAEIASPIVTDVFALDAITEMLDSPLRILSYFELRARFYEKYLIPNEMALLSMHLKYNLWVSDDLDLVGIDEGVSAHLDAAMAVRREGLPGDPTPDGVLTRLARTYVGRIIQGIEFNPEPATLDLGLQLLALSEKAVGQINEGIAFICSQAAKDGGSHDFSLSFGSSSSGLTIHCNYRQQSEAEQRLFAHCSLRKYAERASRWFGLALSPGEGSARFGGELKGEWKQDPEMDRAIQKMPKGIRSHGLKAAFRAQRKIGRNDPCPCGSGKKYKRCHGSR